MSLSIFDAAAEAPDRVALIAEDQALTFAELAGRARRAVAWLRSRGLDGGDAVALVAETTVHTLAMFHALVATGTPALLLHPGLTPLERTALIEAGRAAGTVDPDWHRGGDHRTGAPDPPAHPADERPLAIVHTSGTGGTPRGVVLSRRAFVASAAASAANLGWHDHDRWLLPLPVAHVGGLSIVTRCLLARRAVVLPRETDPPGLVDAVRRHRVTLLSLVPTQLRRIIDHQPGIAPPDPLRALLLGGAAAGRDLLGEAADRGWPVLTTYGLTEACSQVTTQPYGTVNRGELGAGPPLPGVGLRIGEDSEIQLRGPVLFSGYVPPEPGSPFLDDGWFATGDRGRLDDRGNLHVLGRRADRIVTGGENVDPAEVEEALARLPGIAQACVFGAPDAEWGEVVCAAIVPEPRHGDHPAGPVGDGSPVPGRLEDQLAGLRSALAPFKLPRRVAVLDALPLNATGKVDRPETARRVTPHLQPLRYPPPAG